jgi:H+/Cl- antiporter ClcA
VGAAGIPGGAGTLKSQARPPRARNWFSPQPNVPGRGIVAGYSLRFWGIVVVLGVVTGAAAAALIGLLHLVEHIAYGYRSGPFLDGVTAAAPWRRVVALQVAALLVAAGAPLLGRLPVSGGTEVSEAVWLRSGRVAVLPSLARAVLSIVTVGLGVSLGREAAPQLAGAAGASWLSEWARLPVWQRRLLVASGAGAGFAAVYNVPLGGALFALEVLLGTVSLALVLPALATSVIATTVAWVALGTSPTYQLPTYAVHPEQLGWAVVVGPLIGIAAIGWVRLVARAADMRPRRWGRFVAPFGVFLGLGLLAIPYPQLLGNGKGIVQLDAVGDLSLGLACVLLALKPLATAGSLAAGSPGGLFTPTLTIGVLLAGVLGSLWSDIWPGATLGSYAIIGGGAFLAAAMQGPLSGLVLVLELTRNFDSLMAPTLVAVIEATVIARRLGAPSIYSARLRPDPDVAVASAIEILDDPEPPGSPPEQRPGPPPGSPGPLPGSPGAPGPPGGGESRDR